MYFSQRRMSLVGWATVCFCLSFHWQWWEDTRCSWAVPTERGWDKSLCTSRGSSKSIGRSTSAPGTTLKHADELKVVAVEFIVLWANSRSYSCLSLSPVRISLKTSGTCEMSLFACIIYRHRYSSVRALSFNISWIIGYHYICCQATLDIILGVTVPEPTFTNRTYHQCCCREVQNMFLDEFMD